MSGFNMDSGIGDDVLEFEFAVQLTQFWMISFLNCGCLSALIVNMYLLV